MSGRGNNNWKKGRGRGGGGGGFYSQGDRYAAANPAKEEKKYELKNIQSVTEHFHMTFLRPYPDAQLSSVQDFNKGPARLQADDIGAHTSGKNCEFKRRPDFAVSFTAAAVRAMAKMAATIPEAVVDVMPPGDRGSVLCVLCMLRRLLVEEDDGKQFLKACDFLDTGNADVERQEGETGRHIAVFLKYMATKTEFLHAMRLMVAHGATIFTGGSWGLIAAAMPQNMQQWADGFPHDSAIRALYPEELRQWLRDPTDLRQLVLGLTASYKQRFAGKDKSSGSKESWDALTMDGIQETRAEKKEEAPKQLSWDDLLAPKPVVHKPLRSTNWNNLLDDAPPKKKAKSEFAEMEIELSEEEEDEETQIYMEWTAEGARAFQSWAEEVKGRIGQKASQGDGAAKMPEYMEKLNSVPPNVLAHFGLGSIVLQLGTKARVPRNMKDLLARLKIMADAVVAFFDKLPAGGRGAPSTPGR